MGGDLEIRSDLRGLAIDLPSPAGKAAAEPLALELHTAIPRDPKVPLRLRLGDRLQGIFELDSALALQRGAVHFGTEPAQLGDQPGLRISGAAPFLSYTQWLAALAPADASTRAGQMEISSLDLRADVAEVFERQFHKVSLKGVRTAAAWQLDADSEEIAGHIEIPVMPEQLVRMDLSHLTLPKTSTDGNDSALDPRRIPPLIVNSKAFTYGNVPYGALSLVASRHSEGLNLDKLSLRSPWMELDARGNWLLVSGTQYSSFNINAHSKNIGVALANLGYAGTLSKGEGGFNIVARWPGPPTAFALERLDGDLSMSIKDGRLLDVDPGAGRIFGLISLQALPRRLSLDFSDIFKKGFTFDAIQGDFTIKDGQATTRNLHMDGPAARIDTEGLVDLVKGQYDQRVTVSPHLTSGLPLAGAVVGGIGVGAAILIVESMLRPNIEKSARIDFHVTGPWDNPLVERVPVAAAGPAPGPPTDVP
jgi:uncharacterized protein YhdP